MQYVSESIRWKSLHVFLSLAGCKSDSECPLTQACIDRECQNPCPFEQCGVNAECSVRNHKSKCTCLPGHIGNPYERCRRPECLTDPDCSTTLTCRNEKNSLFLAIFKSEKNKDFILTIDNVFPNLLTTPYALKLTLV